MQNANQLLSTRDTTSILSQWTSAASPSDYPKWSDVKAGPLWAYGCEHCRYGYKPKGSEGNLDYAGKTALYRNGDMELCDCRAGVMLQAQLRKFDEKYGTDEELYERISKEIAERKQQRLFVEAGVPPKFQEYTLKGYATLTGGDIGKQTAIQAIREYFERDCVATETGDKYGILLWGESGVGKTGSLSPLFMHYLRNGMPGLWIQYNELMASLRNFQDENVEERIAACKHTEFLFIDDFGDPATEEYASNYSRDVMFRIIGHRCDYRKSMFITTNLDIRQMANQYHQRVLRRLAESCVMVQVTGQPLGAMKGIAI